MTMLNKTNFCDTSDPNFNLPADLQQVAKPPKALKSKNKLFRKAHNKRYRKNSHIAKINLHVSVRQGRSSSIDTQPSTPHNTTQYIVDSAYQQPDSNLYGYNMDPIEYNFNHHAMTGSMMGLMQEKMNLELKPNRETSSSSLSESIPIFNEKGSSEFNYDKYLEEIEKVDNEESLEDIIRGLVDVIKRKDSELISLLSDSRKKDNL